MYKFLVFWCGMSVLAASAWAAGGTAYMAVKAAQKSTDSSADLVEVAGDRGEPQPQEWKVVLRDPGARGGIREIVASGDVMFRREPCEAIDCRPTGDSTDPLDLDSTAHSRSPISRPSQKKLALAAGLRCERGRWRLLGPSLNGMGRRSALFKSRPKMELCSRRLNGLPPPTESTERFTDSQPGRTVGGFVGRVGGTLGGIANGVKNTTLRTVGTVQEFFTGERTIGPRDENDN